MVSEAEHRSTTNSGRQADMGVVLEGSLDLLFSIAYPDRARIPSDAITIVSDKVNAKHKVSASCT